jgi:hypothetical protein
MNIPETEIQCLTHEKISYIKKDNVGFHDCVCSGIYRTVGGRILRMVDEA